MTKEYEDALAKSRIASQTFRAAQDAYRNRTIGDNEFLAARAAYNQSTVEFDSAFSKEEVN